jgi:tRNA (guanine-N(7)-)-methyltransferase subunit TRM82
MHSSYFMRYMLQYLSSGTLTGTMRLGILSYDCVLFTCHNDMWMLPCAACVLVCFQGSYEIQNYCLGHTNFVTCSAAVPAAAAVAAGSSSLLSTGGGDGTVRLWDADTGKQLASYVASEQPKQQEQREDGQQQQEQEAAANGAPQGDAAAAETAAAAAAAADANAGEGADGGSSSGSEGEDDDNAAGGDTTDAQPFKGRPYHRQECAAALSVAVSPDGCVVAAAVEGQQEVQLLQLQQGSEGGAASLQLLQKLAFEEVANPAAVAFDCQGRLWVVGGLLLLETESAHVGVAAREAAGGSICSLHPVCLLLRVKACHWLQGMPRRL